MSDWEQRVERRFHSPRDYLDAARDPAADAELLAGLATVPYDFVREAVAQHTHTTTATLRVLVPDALTNWGHHSLLLSVVQHPAADDEVFRLARERLVTGLLAGRRPYSVAIALAERGGPSAEDVAALGRLPGASLRLRRGLRKALAAASVSG